MSAAPRPPATLARADEVHAVIVHLEAGVFFRDAGGFGEGLFESW